MMKVEFEFLALGHIEPHPEDLWAFAGLVAVQHYLVEDMALRPVCRAPAILQRHRSGLARTAQLGDHAWQVVRVHTRLPQAGLGKGFPREARDPLDAVTREVQA